MERGKPVPRRNTAGVRPPVIVALGAAVQSDGSVSPAMRRRVARAVAEARARSDAVLLFSGGVGKRHPVDLPPEAHLMRDLACAADMDMDRVVLEDVSRNTLGNAVHSLNALAAAGLEPARIVVVTDSAHVPRAVWCFRRVARARGLTVRVQGVGVRITSPRALAVALVRESVALVMYLPRLMRLRRLATAGAGGHDGGGPETPHRATRDSITRGSI